MFFYSFLIVAMQQNCCWQQQSWLMKEKPFHLRTASYLGKISPPLCHPVPPRGCGVDAAANWWSRRRPFKFRFVRAVLTFPDFSWGRSRGVHVHTELRTINTVISYSNDCHCLVTQRQLELFLFCVSLSFSLLVCCDTLSRESGSVRLFRFISASFLAIRLVPRPIRRATSKKRKVPTIPDSSMQHCDVTLPWSSKPWFHWQQVRFEERHECTQLWVLCWKNEDTQNMEIKARERSTRERTVTKTRELSKFCVDQWRAFWNGTVTPVQVVPRRTSSINATQWADGVFLHILLVLWEKLTLDETLISC